MNLNNKIEETTLDGAVPQSTSTETDVNSVSSTTNNYILDINQKQDNSTNKLKIPNFFNFNHFQHSIFAKFANIIRLNGTNHIYSGSTTGLYIYDNELIEFTLQKLVPKFNMAQIKEEVKHLSIATKMSEFKECNNTYVGFNNGIYNIDDLNFKKFPLCNPTEFILTNKLSVDYVENISTSNEIIDKLFNDITGSKAELELFLYEVMGACLCRCSLPFAFVLTGTSSTNGNDGRDIFLDIIRTIAGECASIQSLQELITSKSFHSLYSKTCNISNEQLKTKMLNINKLVGLICGNKILPTKEFSSLTFNPYTTLLFNVRDIIDFEGVFSDLNGYLKIIPFKNQVNVDKSTIDTILTMENLQYITMKALRAFANVLHCGNFSFPHVVENATEKYLIDNNTAREFCIANPIFYVERKSDYYEQYDLWCRENNKAPVCPSQFGKEVIKFGYIPARYSIGIGTKRNNYYTVKNFNVRKLMEQYTNIIEENSIEVILLNGTNSEGKFIESFINFFHSNALEDVNKKSLTEQADVNSIIEKAIEELNIKVSH